MTDLQGVAYIEGSFKPIGEAKISVLDWGFLRSDATYDVVHVWQGRFFRLDAHIERFMRSAEKLHLKLPVDADGLGAILAECVQRSGPGGRLCRDDPYPRQFADSFP